MADAQKQTGHDRVRQFGADIGLGLGFLTRIPVRSRSTFERGRLAQAAHLFPVIGVIVGICGAIVYAGAIQSGLAPALAALAATAAVIWLTRGLHEDGLADFVDGLGGGSDRQSRLRIMRDSHIGAFGVIALVLALAVRVLTLASLADAQTVAVCLIAAAAVSRATMVALMHVLPQARSDGLSHGAGRASRSGCLTALLLAAVATLLILPGEAALWGLIAGALGAAAIALIARRKLGGQTGDVLGAAQQTSESVFLLASAAALT